MKKISNSDFKFPTLLRSQLNYVLKILSKNMSSFTEGNKMKLPQTHMLRKKPSYYILDKNEEEFQTKIHYVNQLTDLAMSSANLNATIGFKGPFLFRYARKSPCRSDNKNVITKDMDFTYVLSIIDNKNFGTLFCCRKKCLKHSKRRMAAHTRNKRKILLAPES